MPGPNDSIKEYFTEKKRPFGLHLLMLVSFPTCKKHNRRHFTVSVHSMKISGLQHCFQSLWLSLYCHKQFNKSSFVQKKASHRFGTAWWWASSFWANYPFKPFFEFGFSSCTGELECVCVIGNLSRAWSFHEAGMVCVLLIHCMLSCINNALEGFCACVCRKVFGGCAGIVRCFESHKVVRSTITFRLER